MAKSYEVVVPVVVEQNKPPVPTGEYVELNDQDAELFLRRGFVKEPEGGKQESSNEQPNEAPGLTVPEGSGREELIAAGYIADSDVRDTDDDTLLAIDGIGKATLERIRKAVPNTK